MVLKTTPRFCDWLGGLRTHQGLAVPSAVIYYSERFQGKISEKKCAWGEDLGQLLPVESLRAWLILPATSCNTVNCFLTGENHQQLSAQVLTRGWSCRNLQPSMYQNSRSLEENQVFSINCIVQVQRATLKISVVGTLPNSKFPDAC